MAAGFTLKTEDVPEFKQRICEAFASMANAGTLAELKVIPISDAKEILQSLMNRQTREQVAEAERGFLGITGRTVDEASAQLYDLPVGVYVSAVQEGSAADKAGIEEGMIITTFDDTNLDGMDSLQSLLKTYKAGEKVKVKVAVPNKRNEYQEKTIEVTLDQARN